MTTRFDEWKVPLNSCIFSLAGTRQENKYGSPATFFSAGLQVLLAEATSHIALHGIAMPISNWCQHVHWNALVQRALKHPLWLVCDQSWANPNPDLDLDPDLTNFPNPTGFGLDLDLKVGLDLDLDLKLHGFACPCLWWNDRQWGSSLWTAFF